MKEKWRSITGFEGLYEVSDHGRVKSLARTFSIGSSKRTLPDTIMKLQRNRNGYLEIKLRRPAYYKHYFIHRLVAQAFLEGDSDVVNHKDRNRENNHLSNLEWASYKENTRHWMEAEKLSPRADIAF